MINIDVSYYISGWTGSLIDYICLMINIRPQNFVRDGLSNREWNEVTGYYVSVSI